MSLSVSVSDSQPVRAFDWELEPDPFEAHRLWLVQWRETLERSLDGLFLQRSMLRLRNRREHWIGPDHQINQVDKCIKAQLNQLMVAETDIAMSERRLVIRAREVERSLIGRDQGAD